MSMTAICSIDAHSPAHRAGVRVGETLTHINGHQIVDVLDYKFYSYDTRLELTLRDGGGSTRTVRVIKHEGEDLGLEFETYLMDRARSCANNCIFCFVDQMPPGMRESLYFKDDDARLSFLMGNYLTLTNLSPREVQRIIDLRISPINVSVHTTDQELRCEMLKNKRGGVGIDIMRRFAENNITMNCQIVACPGINDGPALDKTLNDLSQMYPSVNSVAIVPVGVTKFRQGLYPLRPYRQEEAAAVIDQVEAFGKKSLAERGTALAWCSDEFYLLAKRELPQKSYYEDMTQLENGVGMLRLLVSQAAMELEDADPELEPVPFAIATGASAAPFIRQIVDMAKKQCPKLVGQVYAIKNKFFGETITVSGLITGQDLIGQLKGQELGQRLLIPSNMLRSGENVFLDDLTLEEVQKELGVPITPVEADSGFDLADAILGQNVELPGYALPPQDEYYRYNPG